MSEGGHAGHSPLRLAEKRVGVSVAACATKARPFLEACE